jgi:hypothetical protein
MSLIAFIKIVANINLSNKLIKYRDNDDLNEKIHDFRIKMGFGLHCIIIIYIIILYII